MMEAVEITNLLYLSAELLDKGELESAAKLFRNARVKLSKDSEVLNHQELLSYWQSRFALNDDSTPGTRHMIINPIIHIDAENGTASCRSTYCVLNLRKPQPLNPPESGQYLDEFVKLEGQWQFASRLYASTDEIPAETSNEKASTEQQKRDTNSSTRAKILAAAQHVFSTVGYSDAGIRKIAEVVGFAPTILFRHFGTKAKLFEEALIAALGTPEPPEDRTRFGRHVAELLANPNQPNCPHAMSVLATGNEEAREIAIRVLKEYTITPMEEWLGPPNAESRAREIIALCAGFALYNVQLNTTETQAVDPHMVDWLASSIQAVVDGT